MTTRVASHAGSWYSAAPKELSTTLDEWLAEVGSRVEEVDMKIEDNDEHCQKWNNLPIPGARVIIAPHAAYQYSGPTAAYAYKCLDLSGIKRIFLLGPSHRISLRGCALSSHTFYATPLGDLKLDQSTIAELKATKKFASWRPAPEEAEHSLEMHLPYIYKMCSLEKSFRSPDEYPLLIPILVGETDSENHRTYGEILAKYMEEKDTAFVVSSDFCHWGKRSFDYTFYLPASPSADAVGYSLQLKDENPTNPPIHESIKRLDMMAMAAVQEGKLEDFLANLKKTRNTVCGRHPIALTMAALELLRGENKLQKQQGLFKLLEYQQSSKVTDTKDSSVSYISAVAVIPGSKS